MKSLFILFLICFPAFSQQIIFTDRTGFCPVNLQIVTNSTNGKYFECISHVWTEISRSTALTLLGTGTSGGGTWGSITGTLSDQTDLQTVLTGKFSTTGGTLTGNLRFTDNTYDIGSSGAFRPRNLYLSGIATFGTPLSVANGGTGLNTLGINIIPKGNGTSALISSGILIDSNNNLSIPGSLNSGVGSGFTGTKEINSTSGGTIAFTVADSLGVRISYIWPTFGTGLYLQDSGPATCPTNDPAAPTTCHLLAWANPGGGGGSSGALVLLERHTASNSTSLDFTTCLSATYTRYIIDIVGMNPATDQDHIIMRVSTDGGSTFASANYSWAGSRWSFGGNAQTGATSGSSFGLDVNGGITNSTIVGSFSSSIALSISASGYPRITATSGAWDNTSNPDIISILTGSYKSVTLINAFQIKGGSGNLSVGDVRCYGVAN